MFFITERQTACLLLGHVGSLSVRQRKCVCVCCGDKRNGTITAQASVFLTAFGHADSYAISCNSAVFSTSVNVTTTKHCSSGERLVLHTVGVMFT